MEEVSESGVDVSSDAVGDAKVESSTPEAEAAAVAVDSGSGEPAADEAVTVDSSVTEEEKPVVGECDTGETPLTESTAGESAVSATDADVNNEENDNGDENDDDLAVVVAQVETDENKMTVQTCDEGTTSQAAVEEKAESDAAGEGVHVTDRVEHVTSKADKLTVSVELPDTSEGSAAAVDTSSVETKPPVSDQKTAPDVMTMAGNDELKFGVLVGLVRVGQLSNKDVVDSVLCLVSICAVLYQ